MAYTVNDEPVPGYRLVKFLGRGNFGEVWQANSPGGIHVALKIISLGRREGFKEFKALQLFKSIHYPHLTPITAFWLKDENGYLLDHSQLDTELVGPGKERAPVRGTVLVGSSGSSKASELIIAMGLGEMSLSDRLEQCQDEGLTGIPPQELFEYMEGAARAIDFLNSPRHDLGRGPISPIQHCDIKPQNILIVGGAAQVCDFGLAREVVADIKMTSAAATPAYGAPELLEGNPPSPTTDQYSLAISYVEMRTGSLPFSDPNSYMNVVNAHLQSTLELSQLSPEERFIIQKATSRDPSKRFDTALRMVKALERACPDRHDSVTTPTTAKHEDAGCELVPGYRLVGQLQQGTYERIWAAQGPDRQRLTLLVHDINPAPIDVKALAAVQALPAHPHLAPLRGQWQLDEDYRVIEHPGAESGKQPARLVLAGDLTHSTLGDRSTDCFRRSGRGIPPDELLTYMEQIAEAVDYLNTPRPVDGQPTAIMHGNLRPYNMLLEGDQVRLGNFASARLLIGDSQVLPPGSLSNQPPYAPPEVRESRLTRWSDQYTLAVHYVQFRLGGQLTGPQGSKRRILSQSGNTWVLDLTGLNPLETAAVNRAMASEPSARFDNCRQFVEQLRAAKPVTLAQMSAPQVNETQELPEGKAGEDRATLVEKRPISPLRGTTETPSPYNRETKVDARKSKAGLLSTESIRGTAYYEPEPELAPRKRNYTKPMVVTIAVLVAAVAGGWFIVNKSSPELVAFASATNNLVTAGEEKALLKKITLANSATTLCEPYLSKQEFLDLSNRAAKLRDTTVGELVAKLHEELEDANQLGEKERKARIDGVINESQQLDKEVKDARVAELLKTADRMLNSTAEAQRRAEAQRARELIKKADAILNKAPPETDPTQLTLARQRYNEASELLGDSKEDADAVFEAQLGIARAKAQQKQPLTDAELEQLAKELRSLPSPAKRYEAQLTVLRAAADVGAGVEPDHILAMANRLDGLLGGADAQGQNLRTFLTVGGWENQEVERLLDLATNSTQTQVLAVLNRFRPVNTEELFEKALQHLRSHALPELDEALTKLNTGNTNPEKLEGLKELRILTDPTSQPEKIAEALKRYDQWLKARDTILLNDLVRVAGELAARDSNYLATATSLVKEARDLDPSEEKTAQLHKLYLAQIAKHLDHGPDPFEREAYFKALQSLCQTAQDDKLQDDLIVIALAECAAEITGNVLSSVREKVDQIASTKGPDAEQPPGLKNYEKYVRLVVREKSGGLKLEDNGDLASDLVEVAKSAVGQPGLGLTLEYRQGKVADFLIQSAQALRVKPAEGAAPLEAIISPYGPKGSDRAATAYERLELAKHLMEKAKDPRNRAASSNALFANLALAMSNRPATNGPSADKDFEDLQKILGVLLNNRSKLKREDALAVLYVSSSPPTTTLALKSRADLIEELSTGNSRPSDAEAVAIYTSLVAPALAEAKETPSDAALNEQIARLNFQKCHLIRDNPTAEWPFTDRPAEALAAIQIATRLEPNNPDYLVERGYARLDKKPPELALATADAQAAIAKDPKRARAYALAGKSLLRAARQESKHAVAARLLEKSVQANEKAVEYASDDSMRFFCLLDLGTSYVEWANFVDPKEKSPTELLNKAIESVKEAQKIDLDSYRDMALTRLGNAYEDLAWLNKKQEMAVVTANYDKAIESFSEAIDERSDLAAPRVDLGRCYYKRQAESGDTSQDFMSKAQASLEKAVELDPNKKNASARHWLGKVYLFQGKNAEAAALLNEAAQLARKAKSSDVPVYVESLLQARFTDETKKLTGERKKLAAEDALAIRTPVEELISTSKEDAPENHAYQALLALALARTFELEGNAAEALKIYNANLPADLSQAEQFHVALLKARANLILTSSRALGIKSFEIPLNDARRVIALLPNKPDATAHHLAAWALQYQATAKLRELSAATKTEGTELLKAAVKEFELALALHEPSVLTPDFYSAYAYALSQLMSEDPTVRTVEKPKALKAINEAIRLAAGRSEREKQVLQRMKTQIESL